MDLRSTLNLPDSGFTIPMKANLPQLEPQIQAEWEERGIYREIQRARADAPTYVLHDGPPYTNSPIHIGTAMNKVLKDFVVKSRTMMGFRAPYVPGYDNHGLPIEQTVLREFHARKETPDVATLRRACREHAAKYVGVQTSQFKRLGVFGLWEKPYTTMDFRYEAEIVRVFKRMVEGGYVYKGLRPTLWSPTSRTALADTEIVYQDHTSKAIYVRFPLLHDHNGFAQGLKNVYAVIWTTTPWTIPANLAVAFHPNLEYVLAQVGDDVYIVLGELLPRVAEECGWKDPKVLRTELGVSFEGSKFKHPIFDRESLAVMAEYVTTEDGTGVVHTAPGHGREDFQTGLQYGLPILCPVDEAGVLTEEAGEFAGVSYKDCDRVVVERLREVGNLLDVRDHVHSYPYAERDGQPVIFRATEQWFVAIDHQDLRERMLREIEKVRWVPANGQNRIEAMVRNRPDWCVSRQRPWGVGIPIFYGARSRKPVMDPEAIECVARLIEREGSDAWFVKDPKEILPPGYRHPDTGETEFTKETDVLDVWFDSGATSLCVLEGNVEPDWKEPWPADLYLEGSDQHRGWFNTSLIIATAVRGQAPYREVLTHGFVLDDQMRKMSKRLGNIVDPVDASNRYGADVLRYWVASVDFTNDVPCSDRLLQQFGENYRRVRNTLRFLLANLYDYEPAMAPEKLLELDEWAVEQADLLVADCVEAYRSHQFPKVIGAIHNFCVQEMSSFYLDAIKDRMYCDGKDWPSRRSGQAACWHVLVRLAKLVAPILCHTAEEVWGRIPGVEGSVHVQTFDVPSAERLAEIEASPLQTRFAALLGERADLFAAFEAWKRENGQADSQDVIAEISQEGDTLAFLRSFSTEELALYFKVSWVELTEGPERYGFRMSDYPKCERSRLRRPDVRQVGGVWLSERDRRVLGL
ncbi:MAG: isoleucine--tRNA ligase [Fimbriimonadaceae bacterium]